MIFGLAPGLAWGAEIDVRVAQGGVFAGVRNTLFTQWLPAGQAFAGLSGTVTLAGNHDGFSEALIVVGAMPGDSRDCAARDGTTLPGMPAMARFWAGILKADDATPVWIRVAFALPVPVPGGPGGTCLATLVSAGYPFLRRDVPLTTTTQVRLSVATAPPAGPVTAFGIGGEFKFDTGIPGLATYVGLRAERALDVEGIATSVSAAPVTGAPAQARWGAPPTGAWRVGTRFVLVPAPACTAAGYAGRRSGPDFSVLRLGTPARVAPPAGSVVFAQAPLASGRAVAAQSAGFSGPVPGDALVHLEAGGCLMAFADAQGTGGLVDAENQSTIYLRAAGRLGQKAFEGPRNSTNRR